MVDKGHSNRSAYSNNDLCSFTRCGEEDPPFGWYSPTYGIKMKSGVLSCLIEGAPEDVSFMTAIGIECPLKKEAIERKADLF